MSPRDLDTAPEQFISTRRHDWERLTQFVQRVEGGRLSALSESELVELGALYRAATSDLAISQRDLPTHPLTQYLNQLVGRAHPVIYRGEPLILGRIRDFYFREFPRLYRELAPFILVSSLLFFGTAIVFYFVTLANPDAAGYQLSPGLIDQIKNGRQWWKMINGFNGVGASLIMTNNLGIAFMAFAGGMLLGLFTIYILIFNGLDLGMVFGLLQVYGHAAPLAEFVIGHGVLELSEITMAGGSGIMLGYAILHPGLHSRKDALGIAAQKSIRLLLGSAPLLIVAGIIEGVISPSDAVPAYIKYAIGIASGVLLYGYLILAGRKKTQNSKPIGNM
jgi:uncharacterized membrane protein SpoIIM required for sporulation